MPPALTFLAAGAVLGAVLCCIYRVVGVHASGSATACAGALPYVRACEEELQPQRTPVELSASRLGDSPPTTATTFPHAESIAGITAKYVSYPVASCSSSPSRVEDYLIATLSERKALRLSAGDGCPPPAVCVFHCASRLCRNTTRPRACCRSRGTQSVTTCRYPHADVPILGFPPSSRHSITETEFCLASPSASTSASADRYSCAVGAASSASRRPVDAPELPCRIAALMGPSTPPLLSSNSSWTSSTPGLVIPFGLHPSSLGRGAATHCTTHSQVRVPAVVAPVAKQHCAVTAHRADNFFPQSIVSVRYPPVLTILSPRHRRSGYQSLCPSFCLCGASGHIRAQPSSEHAGAHLKAYFPSPLRDRMTHPATGQGAAASAASSAASALSRNLSLPASVTLALFGRLRSFRSSPPLGGLRAAAFLRVAVPCLTAAAASCLIHLLTDAFAAQNGDSSSSSSRSFAAASQLPRSVAWVETISRIRPPAPFRRRAEAGREVLTMSGSAPAASSVSCSSFFAAAGTPEQQPSMERVIRLVEGDGYGGEGLHYFPPRLSQEQRRQTPLSDTGEVAVTKSECAVKPSSGDRLPVAGAGYEEDQACYTVIACGTPPIAASTRGEGSERGGKEQPREAGGITSNRDSAGGAEGKEQQREEPATLIFLPGLGDSAEGWSDLSTLAAAALPCAASFLRIILPTAPLRIVTITGGMPTRAWADIVGLTKEAPEDEKGFQETKERLDAIIKGEVDAGVHPSRIIIGGFSQGGAVAYHVGLQSPYRLGGIIALSTWIPLPRLLTLSPACTMSPEYNNNSNSTSSSTDATSASAGAPAKLHPLPVLHCHGTNDELVDFAYGGESVSHLRQLYVQAGVPVNVANQAVQFIAYTGLGHTANTPMLADVREFLAKCLQKC